MALAGWGTDSNGRLFWNYVNSWGADWGNKGWVSIYHEDSAWEELGAPFIGA